MTNILNTHVQVSRYMLRRHRGKAEECLYQVSTPALQEGGWQGPRPGRWERDPVRILYEAQWDTAPVWTGPKNEPVIPAAD